MRQLHVLGVSEDGATLLLGTSKNATKPTHRLALDDRLRAATRGQLTAPGSDRAESGLSPKEMQARLREGASVEEVAKAAGVPVARVLPYFVPVEAERTRIVDDARGAYMHRHRGPASTRVLGVAVDAHLQDVGGLKPESITWTARRRRDGAWVVGVSYLARGRRKAEWLWQPATREVTPLDPAAARLGADAPSTTPKRKPAKVAKPAAAKKSAPAAKAKPAKAGKKNAAKSTAKAAQPGKATKKTAAKTPAKTAAKAAPAKARPTKVAKAAATKEAAPTKAAPARKAPATKVTPTKAPKLTKVAKVAKVTKVTKARRPRVVPVPAPESEGPFFAPAVIPLPVPVPVEVEEVDEVEVTEVEPAAAAEQETSAPAAARRPGQRVPVPSWSDVLLGVTRDESRRSG